MGHLNRWLTNPELLVWGHIEVFGRLRKKLQQEISVEPHLEEHITTITLNQVEVFTFKNKIIMVSNQLSLAIDAESIIALLTI